MYENRGEVNQNQVRANQLSRTIRERKPGMSDDGLLPRQLLPHQKEMYDTGGELALKEISRKKAIPKSRVEPHVEQAVVEFAVEQP